MVEQLKTTSPRLATNIAGFQDWLTTIAASEGRGSSTTASHRTGDVHGLQANHACSSCVIASNSGSLCTNVARLISAAAMTVCPREVIVLLNPQLLNSKSP